MSKYRQWAIKLLIIVGCSLPMTTSARFPAKSPALTKSMLPRAMQPRYMPATTRSIAPFRLITDRLSMKQVVEVFGLPDRDIGSGIYIYIYDLADRSQVIIGSPDGKRLLYVIHSQANKQQSAELFRTGSPAKIVPGTVAKGIDRNACDFFKQWRAQLPKSTLNDCELKHGQLDLLIATYTVKGKDATIVEKLLQQRFQMGKLRFICCGWENPEQPGRYRRDGDSYQISMFSGETLEKDWRKIDRFYITVTKYLTEP
ncbi:DUF4952 domain-containing protein [Chamaesiphon sp. OTE_8_metabat_110]|uniref:DUF4952 domain-containing protein n=1 Tax=Chamaesiphon sp. OTE_8_metabat_110 TaxID=2964696 RepID=UPI00286A7689|nr:DUF4952 domain-containing protein [Chamaesiphon sp. OTE_8_metabat_110]